MDTLLTQSIQSAESAEQIKPLQNIKEIMNERHDVINDALQTTNKLHFTHLVFGGGGMKGIAYIGALNYLYQNPELLKDIKTVIGTSVGSYFAVIYILNIQLKEIEDFLKDLFDINNNKFDISLSNFLNIYNTCGLDNNTRILECLTKYIKYMTFLDLTKKTGKDLIVCATNAHTMQPVYFCVNNTPNVLVYDALLASSSLPILMKPHQIGNTFYVDGGVTDHIPLGCIPKCINNDNILILSLQYNDCNKLDTFVFPTLLLNTFLTLISNKGLMQLHEKAYKYYIYINNLPISTIEYVINKNNLSLCLTREVIDKCCKIGYDTLYSKVKKWKAISSD